MDKEYRTKQSTAKGLARLVAPFFWSADIYVGTGLVTHS